MTITMTVGDFNPRANGSFVGTFGMLEAECTEEMKSMTLEQIAKALLKQGKIEHGNIRIYSINFRTTKQVSSTEMEANI